MEWNPTDGGTYEETIAKLTVDANGVHGDQPGFDKANVKTYGLGPGGIRGSGQTEYSTYTGSNGWTATDENCGPPSTNMTIPSSRKPSPGAR